MFCWHRLPVHFSICVPCDAKLYDFQRWSPRGHNLMFYVLAWKPASPRKCPVFGSRTALFFDLLKICQGHEHCWSTPENLRIFEGRSFFFMEIAQILRKICDFLSQDLFFTRALSHYVLGPLAWRGSVFGRCVLGLGFFLYPRLHLWWFHSEN